MSIRKPISANLLVGKYGNYIPERGDIVFLNFNPQTGHEQKGRRPALVISPKIYNQKAGLALLCPITTQEKGYPFEVALPSTCSVAGVILADHVKSLDWKMRKAKFFDRLPSGALEEVIEKIEMLITPTV